jgi:hypothetical protein
MFVPESRSVNLQKAHFEQKMNLGTIGFCSLLSIQFRTSYEEADSQCSDR